MAILKTIGNFLYQLALGLGGPGLFLVALADSSFLSVPEGNDLLIVILSTGQSWSLMAYYVTMTTLGSVVGCSVLYSFGKKGGNVIDRRYSKERLASMREKYHRWGVWAVLVPSVLPPPTPFKVFVLSAGMFRLSFRKFIFAVFVGRAIRYSVWGVLAVLYGEMVKEFLEAHLRNVGIAIAVILTIAGIAFFLFRWRSGGQRDKNRYEMG